MSKKKIVIISIVAIVIVIGIVLWFSTANNEASGYSYSDEYISLGYVPDGLSLESADYGELGSVWCFANGVDYFVLSMESINSNHSFDTENGTAENLQINGNDGVYISTPDVNTLFWGDLNAIYTMTGNLDKSVMIKIAENVNR